MALKCDSLTPFSDFNKKILGSMQYRTLQQNMPLMSPGGHSTGDFEKVVLLLMMNCFLVLPIVWGFCVWSLFCYAILGTLSKGR